MLKSLFSYIFGILDAYCNPAGDEFQLKVDVKSDDQHLQEELEYAYKCYKSEHIAVDEDYDTVVAMLNS